MTTTLDTTLREYVRACFAGIWIRSDEQDEALATIAAVCRDEGWRLAAWDVDGGLRCGEDDEHDADAAPDPLAAVRTAGRLAADDTPGLLVLENFHRFLQSAEIVQATARQIQLGKRQRTFVVVLAPVVELPRELEKLFVVLEHELPDREQLAAIARELAGDDANDDDADEAALAAALDAAAGLTRYEAEGAFALALVRDGRLAAATVREVKAQQLKKSALLSLHEGSQRFDELGGLAALKEFCLAALRRRDGPRLPAQGVLLLSPPGCGKSAFCKALGGEVGRPTLRLDVGALMGSLVGQTEANVRRAMAVAEAMAPCVLMIDEVDKALAGVGGGQADGGVAARMFGTLLSWLADRTSDVFVVATANSVAALPPEFARAERFDGVFFVDLPQRAEKDAIWTIHRRAFDLPPYDPTPADDQWTGAEIRACCRLAALLDRPLVEAAQHVVPVAVSAAEQIDRLRQWAAGRCLAADRPGPYRAAAPAGTRRRGVRIDPSAN